MMDSDNVLPILSGEELRVLGVLIEKSKTTPDYYPMTVNAIAAACNQKTSRNPVVEYDEPTVLSALNSLKSRSLVSTAVGGTIRTVKYKYNLTTVFPLSAAELAILCLLFLRGPQTPGEINTNASRLYDFESLEEVNNNLLKLGNSHPPMLQELPRRPGQKETRFMHLFGGPILVEDVKLSETPSEKPLSELELRLLSVEKELIELREAINKINRDLLG
jgi:uncharacterized protein